jgi:hypothetical protein
MRRERIRKNVVAKAAAEELDLAALASKGFRQRKVVPVRPRQKA